MLFHENVIKVRILKVTFVAFCIFLSLYVAREVINNINSQSNTPQEVTSLMAPVLSSPSIARTEWLMSYIRASRQLPQMVDAFHFIKVSKDKEIDVSLDNSNIISSMEAREIAPNTSGVNPVQYHALFNYQIISSKKSKDGRETFYLFSGKMLNIHANGEIDPEVEDVKGLIMDESLSRVHVLIANADYKAIQKSLYTDNKDQAMVMMTRDEVPVKSFIDNLLFNSLEVKIDLPKDRYGVYASFWNQVKPPYYIAKTKDGKTYTRNDLPVWNTTIIGRNQYSIHAIGMSSKGPVDVYCISEDYTYLQNAIQEANEKSKDHLDNSRAEMIIANMTPPQRKN